jgi:hypothetical protein
MVCQLLLAYSWSYHSQYVGVFRLATYNICL